jgi:hypothetical protein
MLILTGFNRSMMECGTYCVRSVERYITKYPKYHFAVEAIPEGFTRAASWYKVNAILKHLKDHDFVLWLDADSLIVGVEDIGKMLGDKTLNIARDKHGVNHGIAAWKNCPEAFWALETMNRAYDKWQDGIWHEQHALMELEGQMNICYQPKVKFNAYPEDIDSTTQILHFPGMLPHDRLPLMEQAYHKLIA